MLPLFPARQKSVGLFFSRAGPSIFQIGCCHAPAFVLIEPLHDGIILAFFRLLAVPPCIGKISSSPLSVSNCFPFNFWKAFQWPLAIGISKSMVFHQCGANVQSRVPGVNLYNNSSKRKKKRKETKAKESRHLYIYILIQPCARPCAFLCRKRKTMCFCPTESPK